MAHQFTFKRIEKKYLLNTSQYNALMDRLSKIARVDAYGQTRINNIYYDTPDFSLIRRSLEKPVYKEKLRLRTYGPTTSDTNAFIELKKKYKGVVYKRRLEASYDTAKGYLDGRNTLETESQISKEVDYFLKMYKGIAPRMVISYDRIAMAGISDPDLRLTFDRNICYRTGSLDLKSRACDTPILKDGQYLLEIKTVGGMPMELAHALSELGIFPVSFSKYGKAFSKCVESGAIRFDTAPAHMHYDHSPAYAAICA